jgi:hypothetical protein
MESTMTLSRKIDLVALCAAFALVGALVVGASF